MPSWGLPLLVLGLLALGEKTPAATDSDGATSPEQVEQIRALDRAAIDDVRMGHYAEALDKRLQYHRTVMAIAPSMSGVRLSFALRSWKKLAEVYPPALEAMKRERDSARQAALAMGAGAWDSFQEFVAFGRYLDDEKSTVETFRQLDRTNPDFAREVYGVAEAALLRAGEYALCRRYLNPEVTWARIREVYDLQRGYEQTHDDGGPPLADARFESRTATLVALLALDDRPGEARGIAAEARAIRDDPAFAATLERALAGEVPASR